MMVIATLWENWNERVIEAAFLETILFSQVWLTRFLTFSSSSAFCRLHSFYFFCFPQCHGLILASNLTPQNDSLSSCSGMEKRVRIVKIRKLVDWDKNSLKDKGKAGHGSKIRNSCINSNCRSVFSHVQESRDPLHVTMTQADKCHASKCPLCSPSFFFVLGQLSQLFSLITSCAAWLVRWDEEQKRLWACVGSVQQ